MTTPSKDGACQTCGHPFDSHELISTSENPRDGGIVLCPAKGCDCYGTWGIGGRPVHNVPDSAAVAKLRAHIQAKPVDR